MFSDDDWNLWLDSLSKSDRQEVLDVATSYTRKTSDGRIKRDNSSNLIEITNVAA